MSGPRRPMSVNMASGGKHWTKNEVENRVQSEPKVKKPASLTCPKWLSKDAAKLFRAYAKELLACLPVSRLDTLTLARYCDAEWSYSEASRQKSAFLSIAREIMDQEADARGSDAICPRSAPEAQTVDRKQAYEECKAQIAYWTKAMSAYEKIARGAANDMGCTITSRCRLVVPPSAKEEDDPLEQLQQTLRVIHG